MTAQLTFNDEFNSLSLWNGSSGTWATSFWYQDANSNGATLAGNGEKEWYINANYAGTSSVTPWTVSNGVLDIRAAPASAAISSQINGYQYTSGEVNTYHSFSQTYGYFEMKAELPAGQGLWPAFWLLPKDGSWPPELDVMEVLGKDPGTLYTTVHTSESGAHTQSSIGTSVANTASGYHTYGVDWEADKITFYFDGKQVFQTDTPADMHKPMFMLANLAVGGGWPGDPDATTPWPADMKIDYIRAWDSNPYAGGATPSPGTTASSETTPPAGQINGTAGADVLTGQADAYNHIRGLDGDDQITGGSQFNDINGNPGADTITGRSTLGDWLLGGQGADSINASASTGHNIVNGNLGDDRLVGGSGGDTLRGGQGDDVIVGGSGGDWISGDKGSDTLTGGGGADIFHHSAAAGVSTITDFNLGEGDRLQFDAGTSYHTAQVGADVVVSLDGGAQVILQHTQLSSLTGSWVI